MTTGGGTTAICGGGTGATLHVRALLQKNTGGAELTQGIHGLTDDAVTTMLVVLLENRSDDCEDERADRDALLEDVALLWLTDDCRLLTCHDADDEAEDELERLEDEDDDELERLDDTLADDTGGEELTIREEEDEDDDECSLRCDELGELDATEEEDGAADDDGGGDEELDALEARLRALDRDDAALRDCALLLGAEDTADDATLLGTLDERALDADDAELRAELLVGDEDGVEDIEEARLETRDDELLSGTLDGASDDACDDACDVGGATLLPMNVWGGV